MERAKKAKRPSEYERIIGKAQVIADRLKEKYGIVLQGFISQITMQTRSKVEAARQVLAVYESAEKFAQLPKSKWSKLRKGAIIGDSYGRRKKPRR